MQAVLDLETGDRTLGVFVRRLTFDVVTVRTPNGRYVNGIEWVPCAATTRCARSAEVIYNGRGFCGGHLYAGIGTIVEAAMFREPGQRAGHSITCAADRDAA